MVYGSALSNSTSVNAVGVAVSARHVAREVPEEAELDRKTIDILDFVACEAEGRRQLGALLEEGGDVLTLLQRCARRQVLLQLIQLSPQTGRIRLDRLEAAHLERACSLQEPRLQRLQLAAACDVQHDDAILLPPQEDAVFPADS